MSNIAISLSPNIQRDDVLLAVKLLFSINKWFDNELVTRLEKDFGRYIDRTQVLAVNSGRVALYLILKSLGVKRGDEVIIQAFTCTVVPNSIITLNATPVYVDIDNTFNIKVDDLKHKITKRTKAIIVQHTFGIPAQIEKIKKVADKYGIEVIEDCAHGLGLSIKKKMVGTLANYSFFSFGRDKSISSVFGGMIVCKKESDYLYIQRLRDTLPKAPLLWSLKQLVHPILFKTFVLPFYGVGLNNISLGKIFLYLMQEMKIITFPVDKSERKGVLPKELIFKYPPLLAGLAIKQLGKIGHYNTHRKEIASFYEKSLSRNFIKPATNKDSIYLRYPVRHPQAKQIIKFLKKQNILIGDWYKKPVEPADNLKLYKYEIGSCPTAERYCKTILNLPTNISFTIRQAEVLVETLNKWKSTT